VQVATGGSVLFVSAPVIAGDNPTVIHKGEAPQSVEVFEAGWVQAHVVQASSSLTNQWGRLEPMPGLSGAIKRHPIITFFVLTYVITWSFVPFGSFGAFGPLLAAVITAPLTRGRAGLKELGLRIIRWRVRWYWYAVAIGLPLAIHGLTVLINQLVGIGIPRQGFTSIAGWLLIFGARLINPVDGPVGEEPGWRGFALPGLQATRSPLVSTAILAVLITIWHLPLFFVEGAACRCQPLWAASLGRLPSHLWLLGSSTTPAAACC
jgi:membrane protease YdiL (CAAX protease family)